MAVEKLFSNPHGGKREGAGRPNDAIQRKYVGIRLTEQEHTRFRLLGGTKWVLRMLNSYKQPAPTTPTTPNKLMEKK